MNSKNDQPELKAGHPPAVKAGKMRITQHKTPHDSGHQVVAEDANLLKISTSSPNATLVSGAPTHGHSDFSSEAVQKIHNKPLPTHEQVSGGASKKPIIQQPRK